MTEQNQNENSYIYNAHQSVLYEMWKAIWLQKQSTHIFLVSTFFFLCTESTETLSEFVRLHSAHYDRI